MQTLALGRIAQSWQDNAIDIPPRPKGARIP